ncbi:MAG: biopolymer transporter ExbD, partial [Thermoguttaceae bacterium]
MYKRRKTSGDQLQAKPTIISLADVALCLLVIVLSTGGAVRQLMEVSLPEAENSASRDINLAVNLTVTRDGKYYFEDDRTAIRDEERVGPKQLDDKGLLFAASWDDNALNGRADRACGNPLAYFYPGHRAAYSNEGAKGWCMNSQLVCEILDSYRNIDYYEGTVCFYVRKDPLVRNENTFVPDPKETVRFPCGRSNNGETLFTAGLVQNAGSSNSGITLRRFRSWQGKDGYLQLAYQMMGGRLVACQAAPFPWSEEWRHVAILWSVK